MKQNHKLTATELYRQSMNCVGGTARKDIQTIKQVRTLIADDSPWMLGILARVLALEGNFTLVGTVTDGRQAVRQALLLEPELVLIDYSMPHVNGVEATRYIKQLHNPPLVILVTANDTPECRALANAAGADGFVVKGGDLRNQLRSIFQKLFHFTLDPLAHQERSRVRARAAATDQLNENGWSTRHVMALRKGLNETDEL